MSKTFDVVGRLVSTAERPTITAGFVGCGSHAFRSILPSLQFLPVDLVATCDLVAERAERYAEQFGAERSYADYREMLDEEDLDAVFAVLGYDDDGWPLYPPVAMDAMRAGCDVWIEKPPAASVETVEEMRRVEEQTGNFVHVGYKKAYVPAIEKAKELTEREEFGPIDSLYVRGYPGSLPERDDPHEAVEHGRALWLLLDHIVHPGAIVSYIGGPMESILHQSSDGGGGFVNIRFTSGAMGTIHMTEGSSGSAPLERVEVIGDGANVVVDNGIELTYYRPYDRGPYGRTTSWMGGIEEAPIRWVPEFSTGHLYNKNLVTLGYYGELEDFVESCLDGRPPDRAGLEMSLELLKLYEALLQGEDRLIEL